MGETCVEILLVEENTNDAKMTLHAFKKYNLGNRIHVVRDGAEALEYVFCTGRLPSGGCRTIRGEFCFNQQLGWTGE